MWWRMWWHCDMALWWLVRRRRDHVVVSPQVGELRELQTICREYVAGLRLGLLRKQTSEPSRAVELASYFTHCSLQPAHTMLALNSAMKLAYKVIM